MAAPRTTCRECDEPLWGAAERFGLCGICRDRERASYDDGEIGGLFDGRGDGECEEEVA